VPEPCEPARIDSSPDAPDHYVAYTASRVWTVTAVRCDPGTTSPKPYLAVVADAIDLSGASTTDPSDVLTLRIDYRDIVVAAPLANLSLDLPFLFRGLSLLGVTDEAAYWQADNAVLRIDLATSRVVGVPYDEIDPWAPSPGPLVSFSPPAGLVGDTVILDSGGSTWKADFTSGALVPFPAPAAPCLASASAIASPYASAHATAAVLPPHDEVWCHDRSNAYRLNADGSVVTTPPIEDSIFMLFAGGGSLWALVNQDPGEAGGLPARIDPATGTYLFKLEELSPDAASGPGPGFGIYVNADGMLAFSDRNRVWWVHNDGTTERFAPLDFDIVGLTESHYIGVRDDGTAFAGLLDDLPRIDEL
jgi:hypothetical protein